MNIAEQTLQLGIKLDEIIALIKDILAVIKEEQNHGAEPCTRPASGTRGTVKCGRLPADEGHPRIEGKYYQDEEGFYFEWHDYQND